jgi:aspartate kinase
MPGTVMKFGGTSVADAAAIRSVIALVAAAREAAAIPPIVVVSAMSKVTDRLLGLCARAAGGRVEPIDDLRERHFTAIADLVPSDAARLQQEIGQQLDELAGVLTAISILHEASPRALDRVASSGEILNSQIVAAALTAAGIPAAWVDARKAIVTDETYTSAAPLEAETREAVAREVLPHRSAGRVVVLGGYVGATRDGVTTTLGRGGSDYSAAIVGAAVDAGEIQIWTDVDGMLTADPRIVANPALVPSLSFGEASELAYFGAKVLHPSTILPAVEKGIPVRILNTHKPSGRGTLITAQASDPTRSLAAIACKRGVTVVEITSTRMLMAHGFLKRVFEVFDRHRTAVDVVTTSEVSVSMTIDDDRQLPRVVEDLGEFADVVVDSGMAIVCAVGDRLRDDSRLGVRIISALAGFPLRMVSQAGSRRNLTVVMTEADAVNAMTTLHQEFFAAGAVASEGTR